MTPTLFNGMISFTISTPKVMHAPRKLREYKANTLIIMRISTVSMNSVEPLGIVRFQPNMRIIHDLTKCIGKMTAHNFGRVRECEKKSS